MSHRGISQEQEDEDEGVQYSLQCAQRYERNVDACVEEPSHINVIQAYDNLTRDIEVQVSWNNIPSGEAQQIADLISSLREKHEIELRKERGNK